MCNYFTKPLLDVQSTEQLLDLLQETRKLKDIVNIFLFYVRKLQCIKCNVL